MNSSVSPVGPDSDQTSSPTAADVSSSAPMAFPTPAPAESTPADTPTPSPIPLPTRVPESGGGAPAASTLKPPTPTSGFEGELEALEKDANKAVERFGFVTLGLFLALFLCAVWRLYVCCKRRRERRMLELASARADNVLGDMQMIPNDEYDDDDPELL